MAGVLQILAAVTSAMVVVRAERSEALLRRAATLPERRRLVQRRRRVFSDLTSVQHAGFAIDRGNLAGPHRLDPGIYFLDQLLENQVEGAVVLLIGTRTAALLLPITVRAVRMDCVS